MCGASNLQTPNSFIGRTFRAVQTVVASDASSNCYGCALMGHSSGAGGGRARS